MHLFRVASIVCLLGLPALAQEPLEPGFEIIFDGRSLEGWEGDPTYWSVADGKLVGTVTPETLLDRNTFIMWRGGEVADFDLRLEYRISNSGNSGINYRSIEVPETPFAMRGYQADIHGGDRYTGNVYEERGRTFLALRGQKAVVEANQVATVVERFAAPTDLQAYIRKEEGWNAVRIVARGNHIQQYFNGRLFAEVIDNDAGAGQRRGMIGVQVHVGPPMRVEYRHIRLKRLGTTNAPVVAFDQLPERQSNSDVQPLIDHQAAALLAPGPEAPLGGRLQLSVRSRPRYVRGVETDLVLDFEGRALKIPTVPVALQHLAYPAVYNLDLEWDQDAYRITRVRLDSHPLY
ncbi:MAG: DUF1080 domain-containing protein [Acidobacteria bacterium]|nr:DUF1080 domain-containing protein [Acidobacteriota bacterium]MDA1235350.1 DUF1080 domain-containing protein [Acidobacteriota bacterium]